MSSLRAENARLRTRVSELEMALYESAGQFIEAGEYAAALALRGVADGQARTILDKSPTLLGGEVAVSDWQRRAAERIGRMACSCDDDACIATYAERIIREESADVERELAESHANAVCALMTASPRAR